MTTRDEWFLQHDVERQLVAFPDWDADLVTVFESRSSYVESFYSFCLPVTTACLSHTFSDPSWTSDYNSSRVRIFQEVHKHFLTRAFRNRAGSIELRSLFHPFYLDTSTERVVARQEARSDYAHCSKRILINPKLLARFLAQTRQTLLWCVRSIRFTERRLDELQTESYEERITRDMCIYIRGVNPITPEGKHHLPRMESTSRVFGKRHVHEIN